MFTLLVAGGIASGKSTVARRIERLGGIRIDLDQVARDVVAPGSALLPMIAERFGADVVDPMTGELRRQLLAERAFDTPVHAAELEAIEHPAIREELRRQVDKAASWGHPPLVCVVEVPLLDKAMDLVPMADEVLCVTCPIELRRERAIARGVDAADFDRRVANQPSDAFLSEHADCTIVNSGTADELDGKVDKWWYRHIRRGWARSEDDII